MSLQEKLIRVQQKLKAPKSNYNSFGKYNYRSCEDILEAVKPLCAEEGILLNLEDEAVSVDGWHYIKAVATVLDSEARITSTAFAREPEEKRGMDASQVTGTASSYARKYALNGLFCIDDTKDADTDEHKMQTSIAEKTQVKKAKKPKEDGDPMNKPATDEQKKNLASGCKLAGIDAVWVIEQVGSVPGQMTVGEYNQAMNLVNETLAKNEKEGN